MLSKSASVICLIWNSKSKDWVFSATVCYDSFIISLRTVVHLLYITLFFSIKLTPKMLLQVVSETRYIFAVHWRIGY